MDLINHVRWAYYSFLLHSSTDYQIIDYSNDLGIIKKKNHRSHVMLKTLYFEH